MQLTQPSRSSFWSQKRGQARKGDLAGVFVYKFDCVNQVYLLAYEYDPQTRVLLLVGAHENFYRNLKQ